MPSPQRSGSSAVVLLATGAVVLGVIIFAAVVNLASTGKTASKADTDLYVVGNAKALAGTVSRTGPLLFQDLLGNSRDIYVQHVGGDDWRTFEAHAPGAPRRCVLRWESAPRQFVDPCDQRIYPAGGAGLTTFPTSVDPDGRLVVDLQLPQPPTTMSPTTVSPPPS